MVWVGRGGCRRKMWGVFFEEELGAWGGGEDAFGRMFLCGECRRGEQSERERRPVAALRPRQVSRLGLDCWRTRRFVGGTWLIWWGSEVSHRRLGFGRAWFPVGQAAAFWGRHWIRGEIRQ